MCGISHSERYGSKQNDVPGHSRARGSPVRPGALPSTPAQPCPTATSEPGQGQWPVLATARPAPGAAAGPGPNWEGSPWDKLGLGLAPAHQGPGLGRGQWLGLKGSSQGRRMSPGFSQPLPKACPPASRHGVRPLCLLGAELALPQLPNPGWGQQGGSGPEVWPGRGISRCLYWQWGVWLTKRAKSFLVGFWVGLIKVLLSAVETLSFILHVVISSFGAKVKRFK